ncbi:MAG: hypothetical protein SFU25_07505 [Candidatus Caenarcaniphilales bacterium]|nr:hypothetical protein [Candidatus Caenarcaniphilales bacterium]
MDQIAQNLNKTDKGPTAILKLREDLELIPAPDGSIQIKDPSNGQFFYLGEKEAKIIKMLPGLKNKKDLLLNSSLNEEQIDYLFKLLYNYHLLEGTVRGAPVPQKKSLFGFLFRRLAVWNPEPILKFSEPKLRWLWSAFVKVLVCCVLIKGLMTSIEFKNEFVVYGWPAIGDSWIVSLVCFATALCLVLVGHEFMHGLALKRYGGSVKEMGICLVYLSPSFYTDVSDIYKLTDNAQKVWVMLIGPIFQAVIGSIAIILWSQALPHETTSDVLYLTAVAAFFTLGFNLNPLLKMDGYRAAEFAFNLPNLRSRAWDYVWSLITRKPPKEELNEKLTLHEKIIFLLYTPLSLIYSYVIFVMLISFYLNSTLFNVPASTVIFCTIALVVSLMSEPKTANKV